MDTLCGDRVCDCSRGVIGALDFRVDRCNSMYRSRAGSRGCQFGYRGIMRKVSPEYDEAIKHTKDLAAGAVLILAVMS